MRVDGHFESALAAREPQGAREPGRRPRSARDLAQLKAGMVIVRRGKRAIEAFDHTGEPHGAASRPFA